MDRLQLLRLAVRTGTIARKGYRLDQAESLFRRYRGLDGFPWPQPTVAIALQEGLAPIDQLPAVRDYYEQLANSDDCDLIGLDEAGRLGTLLSDREWISAGFDVGYFESEWSHYSGILNEVVFGEHPRLRPFFIKLNEHLLFRNKDDAFAFILEHVRAEKSGDDVERGVPLVPIEVSIRIRAT